MDNFKFFIGILWHGLTSIFAAALFFVILPIIMIGIEMTFSAADWISRRWPEKT
jgi:hypothetical protein